MSEKMTERKSDQVHKISAVVLAGGKSRRMQGDNKAFMPYGNSPMIERVIRVFSNFGDILLIASKDNARAYSSWLTNQADPLFSKVEVLVDDVGDKGPVGGIMTGLKHCRYHTAVFAPVDMPNLSEAYYKLLIDCKGYASGAVVRSGSFLNGTCGVYDKRLYEDFEEAVLDNYLSLNRLIQELGLTLIDQTFFLENGFSSGLFLNVNTRADLEKGREMNTAK